jgi:hypothetical protein
LRLATNRILAITRLQRAKKHQGQKIKTKKYQSRAKCSQAQSNHRDRNTIRIWQRLDVSICPEEDEENSYTSIRYNIDINSNTLFKIDL